MTNRVSQPFQSMIIVKIKAGLGNQMFQYALSRRLALDWQDELKFDLSWFDNIKSNETPRTLEIDKFNITLNKATETEISQSMRGVIARTIINIVDRMRGRLNRNYFYRFRSGLLRKRKFLYLDGYFQSYKYFDSIRKLLFVDFSLKNGYSAEGLVLKGEIEQADQSVGIHIRRGDFAASCKDWNGLCNIAYYQKALVEIRKKHKNVKLFIVSDDIEWAKENLKFDSPIVFVSRPALNAAEELLLMSLCKHQIIANSTFSWWSAWLNQNLEKIVVAPSRWLVAADIDTSDLLPPEWIRI